MLRVCLLIASFAIFALSPFAFAAEPRSAKRAVAFPEQCRNDRYYDCKPVQIPSPDRRSNVEVLYKPIDIAEGDQILEAFLRVTTPTQNIRDAALPTGFQDIDLLWSQDSKAFFVNGGNGGSYWGFWVYVYLADDPSDPREVTEQAQRDMLKQFPACKAAYPSADDARGCKKASRAVDEETCMKKEVDPKFNPEYNMTGIDWVGPSSVLVLAEVPCDTQWGGTMCQVMGYELNVPTGRILNRIDAKELKRRWQKSMAWEFHIPEPPVYCE